MTKWWNFMPLICVILLIVVFCVQLIFFDQTPLVETLPTEEILETTEPIIETEPTEEFTEPTDAIVKTPKYIGVYADEQNELSVFEESINVLGWFDTFDSISYNKLSLCLDDHKYTAFITLEPEHMALKNIASGKYDDKIIAYFQEISKGDRINTELYIRFAHEMEMRPSYKFAWYDWQGLNHEVYINAWIHVVALGREYAPNVKWVWSPNRADKYADAYYPGDKYVDCVGVTLNNTATSDLTFDESYENLGKREYLEKYNKPIILSEVANHRFNTQSQIDYMMQVFQLLENNDNYIGVVFFNRDKNSERLFQFSNDAALIENFIHKVRELTLR